MVSVRLGSASSYPKKSWIQKPAGTTLYWDPGKGADTVPMTNEEFEKFIANWKGTPEEVATLTAEWNASVETAVTIAKPLVERELMIRKQLARLAFPEPVEGSKNRTNLPAGWALKLTYCLDRKVEEPVLDLNKEEFEKAGINVDNLIRWKPELKVKEYKELSEEQRKVFDQALVVKPSTPQLELLPPGKR